MSVCGTVVRGLKLRGFSWKQSISSLAPRRAFRPTPQLRPADLPTSHAYALSPGLPTPGLPNFLRPPIASTTGAGILTRFPSATAFALTLGADSPSADERGGGNLGLSASGPFTRFIATHVSIRTSDTSSSLYKPPSPAYGTLSYRPGNRGQETGNRFTAGCCAARSASARSLHTRRANAATCVICIP